MRRTIVAALALAITGCAMTGDQSSQSSAPRKAQIGTWGVDLAGMDTSVKPGDDFFRYVNGSWLDQAVIPPDRSNIGSFTDLAILSETRTIAIMRDLESRPDTLSADEKKVRDLFHSYVDTARIEELGLAPAQKELAALNGLRTHEQVAAAMGSVPMGTVSLFDVYIAADDKHPNQYVVNVLHGGIGLPERDYYTRDDTKAVREAYRKYIAEMLTLGGVANAEAKADRIFALEAAIAKLHWPAAERRDAEKMYNAMTIAELERYAPRFAWKQFFGGLGIGPRTGGERSFIVNEKSAFPGLARLFRATPVSTWRDYLVFHYLSDHAQYLPKRFDDARFGFYGKALLGTQQQLAREKRGVAFVNANIGEALGKLYVARHFTPEARAKAQALVDNLVKVYRTQITTRDWMSEGTKPRALEKMDSFTVKIGYPDRWRDYTAYPVDPDDLFGNASRGRVFEWNRRLARIDNPVDRSEWGMTPQTVNAYYNATFNEIVFPAAILQPPFFDPNADDAVNYGGIGAVIGHEIGHGFDDQGSRYDAKGVLANWWTEQDRAAFDKRSGGLVQQYNAYSPLPGLNVNGQLTLGENIGDLAGASVAFAAYKLSLGGKPAPVLDGFTGEQRFFLGFGQIWRQKATDGYTRQRVLSNPHSPNPFRANGPVRNVDAWYAAFNVQPGDKLYLPPEQRIVIW
jgi:putative endopeptidase